MLVVETTKFLSSRGVGDGKYREIKTQSIRVNAVTNTRQHPVSVQTWRITNLVVLFPSVAGTESVAMVVVGVVTTESLSVEDVKRLILEMA